MPRPRISLEFGLMLPSSRWMFVEDCPYSRISEQSEGQTIPGTRIENTVVVYLGNEDSADISNPIHSTEVAKAYGFTGPIVGGVTVWGWATDTILEALGED